MEALIPADHPARLIWELSGRFEWAGFTAGSKSREGAPGRPCWEPRLLASIWIYGYSLGVASARALERMMRHEPGLRWLAADQALNHHTLADFRVGHPEALEGLFAQFLALLAAAGVVNLQRLLVDGTKVRAVAGAGSLHRRPTLEKRLREARRVIRKLDQDARSEEAMDARRQAAQERAAREAVERATAALEKLRQLEERAKAREREALRVSDSEADARKMKHPDGSWAPSYNVQVTTEERSRLVVGVAVTSDANDARQLLPALERAEKMTGTKPRQIVGDNGYASRQNVEGAAAKDVELIAPWKEAASRAAGACARNGIAPEFAPAAFRLQRGGQRLFCPADKPLVVIQEKVHHGVRKQVFEARARDCRRCRHVLQCCGARGGPRRIERVRESRPMREYLQRMKQRVTRALYHKRCEIAEFPHLWAKGVKKWRRFSVRGLAKAKMEATWVALAYNVTQWLRLQKNETAAAA